MGLVSLRLDEEAERALEALMQGGLSRSEAIRDALVETARRRADRSLEAEALRLASDPDDLAEMAEIAVFMESLRAEG